MGEQAGYQDTKLLGGSKADAKRASFVGNILGGFIASSAASRFSLNEVVAPKITSFIDDMNPEDALRYEQWNKYAETEIEPADRVKLMDRKYAPAPELYLVNKKFYPQQPIEEIGF